MKVTFLAPLQVSDNLEGELPQIEETLLGAVEEVLQEYRLVGENASLDEENQYGLFTDHDVIAIKRSDK